MAVYWRALRGGFARNPDFARARTKTVNRAPSLCGSTSLILTITTHHITSHFPFSLTTTTTTTTTTHSS
jgi:hypothetical protein